MASEILKEETHSNRLKAEGNKLLFKEKKALAGRLTDLHP